MSLGMSIDKQLCHSLFIKRSQLCFSFQKKGAKNHSREENGKAFAWQTALNQKCATDDQKCACRLESLVSKLPRDLDDDESKKTIGLFFLHKFLKRRSLLPRSMPLRSLVILHLTIHPWGEGSTTNWSKLSNIVSRMPMPFSSSALLLLSADDPLPPSALPSLPSAESPEKKQKLSNFLHLQNFATSKTISSSFFRLLQGRKR